MAATLGWETDSDAWDTLALDGTILPGVWKVEPSISRVLDVKVRRKQDAATIRDRGTEPTRFRIEGQILDAEDQWQAFAASFETLAPRRGAARGAVTIVHPAAQLYGVTAVMVETVQGPEIRDGIGVVYIDALEDAGRTKKKRAQPTPDFAGGGVLGLDYPNWQRNSPFASAQPPTADVDFDLLMRDS